MRIKKSTFWLVLIGVVLILAGAVLNSGNIPAPDTEGNVKSASGAVQVVKMSVQGSQYIFEPSSVKKGIPVRLEADITQMPGCSKSVINTPLGIRKTFTSTDRTLEFTPNKAGTFTIACSMNMYQGKLTVLESDGSASAYVQAPVSGGSCGVGGGECGCGA